MPRIVDLTRKRAGGWVIELLPGFEALCQAETVVIIEDGMVRVDRSRERLYDQEEAGERGGVPDTPPPVS